MVYKEKRSIIRSKTHKTGVYPAREKMIDVKEKQLYKRKLFMSRQGTPKVTLEVSVAGLGPENSSEEG